MRLEEFAFDTEFTSLQIQYKGKSQIVGCSFSWGKYNNYYVPLFHQEDDDEEQIPVEMFVKYMKPVFARTDVRLIGHNLKAEMHVLANIGIEVMTTDLFDTLVAVWNIDENESCGLKEITQRIYKYNQRHFDEILLTIPNEIKPQYGYNPGQKGDASLVKILYLAPYALDDTFWTWQIYLDVQDAMEDEGAETYFYKRQMPYLRVLFNKERRGIKVDFERLYEMDKMAEKDLEDLEYRIYEIAGIKFSITSDQQLYEILFGFIKKKPIYEITLEPIIDPNTGEQAIYKSGKNKGELKWKEIKNKDKIVGYEESCNKELIENTFGFPVTVWTKGGKDGKNKAPATNSDALQEILKLKYKRDKHKKQGQEMVKLVLVYKKLEKLRSTYMKGLADQVYSDGKIHTSFNQTGTTSGRLSSSGPNLQNLPRPVEEVFPPKREYYNDAHDYEIAVEKYKEAKEEYDFWIRYEIRDVFIPDDTEEETIVAHDFDNLEMKILAHFSQDPLLVSMFARGVDAHGDTAVNMFDLDCDAGEAKKKYHHLRQQAKVINFLLVYGGTAVALSNSLDVTRNKAQELYDLYFSKYVGVKKFVAEQKKYGHKHGYVYTVLGRKRHLEGINSSDMKTSSYFERLAVNSPIQGSAADIVISAQLKVENDEVLKSLGYTQRLQIHDEIVGVCPKKNAEKVKARVSELMENALPKALNNVALTVSGDFAETYARAK